MSTNTNYYSYATKELSNVSSNDLMHMKTLLMYINTHKSKILMSIIINILAQRNNTKIGFGNTPSRTGPSQYNPYNVPLHILEHMYSIFHYDTFINKRGLLNELRERASDFLQNGFRLSNANKYDEYYFIVGIITILEHKYGVMQDPITGQLFSTLVQQLFAIASNHGGPGGAAPQS